MVARRSKGQLGQNTHEIGRLSDGRRRLWGDDRTEPGYSLGEWIRREPDGPERSHVHGRLRRARLSLSDAFPDTEDELAPRFSRNASVEGSTSR